jgi:chorismate mutase
MLDKLRAMAKDAARRGDWDECDFFMNVESEIRSLRILGKVVASMYEGGLPDDKWQLLFEALTDADLLTNEDEEGDEE